MNNPEQRKEVFQLYQKSVEKLHPLTMGSVIICLSNEHPEMEDEQRTIKEEKVQIIFNQL